MHRLSELPDIGRVHIRAHSMGAWLAMEALRENAISGNPDLNGKLGDVMLAAPDIDLNVFQLLPNKRRSATYTIKHDTMMKEAWTCAAATACEAAKC